MTSTRLIALVDDLRARDHEDAWFEFKKDNINPEKLGATISGLANGARLADKESAYLIWGIDDVSKEVVGTSFKPMHETKGNQALTMWFAQQLDPYPNIQFHVLDHPQGRVVVAEIAAATTSPVNFDRVAYIRIGSATPRLSDHRELEAALWLKLRPFAWESGVAATFLTADEVLDKLDYTAYFSLTKQRLPDNRDGIFQGLVADHLVRADFGGRWNIHNIGALLFAKRLEDFPTLQRKAVRVIEYATRDRTETRRRQDGNRGYAAGFEGLIEYIDGLIPRSELIGKALRTEHSLYPPIAIRELVANALIHQDLTIAGTGPLIEIFPDRVEITSPGKPLRDPQRFLDMPPLSRNEALAALMRRMGVCEEQGSGVDKAVAAIELWQLPPPDFRFEGDMVRVLLLGPRTFSDMTAAERVRACYQHAVLRYISEQKLTNASLRDRFGLPKEGVATVSRIIREAVESGAIKVADPAAPKSGYVPSWA